MKTSLQTGVLLVLVAFSFAASPSALPFLHDDYAKARAEARQRRVPIFVEVSAPW